MVAEVLGLRELHVQCLVASDTSHLGAVIMEVVIPGLFKNLSLVFFLRLRFSSRK